MYKPLPPPADSLIGDIQWRGLILFGSIKEGFTEDVMERKNLPFRKSASGARNFG